MGDLVGQAVDGKHYYVHPREFARAAALSGPAAQTCALFANLARINALYMIARAGSGHIGSSFSSLDIVSWLYLHELAENGIYFSSKGHDAPGLYSVLIALGRLPLDKLHLLRRLEGLPGHPDIHTDGMPANTGSLGMGISKAKGMIRAARLKGRPNRLFVMTGDGELQEGQIWESLVSAANDKLHELTVIVDHNKLQSDTFVRQVSDLGDLEAKFRAFGWHAVRVDGHDLEAFSRLLRSLESVTDKPKVIIADTIKGKGVSIWESTAMAPDQEFYKYHSGAPLAREYRSAVQELIGRANEALVGLNASPLELESVDVAPAPAPADRQRLVPAYTKALLNAAESNGDLVALDADLILDTGLIEFRDRYPARFIECGIAEQDMVSQASGLALSGMLPVVHSFACFLSTRPNEQIYNNCTEGKKIIYVGSLAGVLPAGPGHSHQSVRDISALGSMPGLVMVQPSSESDVGPLLDWCINTHDGASYIRLVSVPSVVNFSLPAGYKPVLGQGVTLVDGKDAVIFAYGPTMLAEAMKAAENVGRRGVSVKVINIPWLNRVDSEWLVRSIGDAPLVLTVDDHYVAGGQGQMLASAFTAARPESRPRWIRIGLTEVPRSGAGDEVLRHHRMDSASIEQAILTGRWS